MQGNANDEAPANKGNMAAAYFQQLSGQEKEPDTIMLDHSYAKPWNAHPDASHAKPARMLFMKNIPRHRSEQLVSDREAQVDVESVSSKIVPPCDSTKSRILMNECERYANAMRPDGSPEDWEENINKSDWTPSQLRLFNKTLKVLHADRLARLADEGAANEPVLRRIVVDKSAQRMRQVFSTFSWDMKLLSWLHIVLMENLSAPYLMAYLDVLQSLRAKVPTMIDKMLSFGPHKGPASLEALSQLLKKTWDPLSTLFSQHKPVSLAEIHCGCSAPVADASRKVLSHDLIISSGTSIDKRLPGNPLFVIVPSGPSAASNNQSQRTRFWQTHLATFGKVVPVTLPPSNGGGDINVTQCLEQIVSAVRAKVVELKESFPNRPVILIGWTIGALIACHVSLVENVNAVICLGFPLTGPNGSRGDLDDPLLDSRTPTLFVVGQKANMCLLDDIEDFRERMKAETGLVVVGGADDNLRICNTKRKLEGITQGIVDRCIVDEIGDFVANVLTQSPAPSTNGSIGHDGKYSGAGPPVVKRKYKRRTPKDPNANSGPTTTKRKPRTTLGRQNGSSAAAVLTKGAVPPASPLLNTTETSSTASSSASDNVTGIRNNEGKKTTYRKQRKLESEQAQQQPQQQQPPAQQQSSRKRRASKLTIDLSDPNELSALLSGSGPSDIFRSASSADTEGFFGQATTTSKGPPFKRSRGISLNIGSLSSLGQYRQNQQSHSFSRPSSSPSSKATSSRLQSTLEGTDAATASTSSSHGFTKESNFSSAILSQVLSQAPSSSKHASLATPSMSGKKSSTDTTYFMLPTSSYTSALNSSLLSSVETTSSVKTMPTSKETSGSDLQGSFSENQVDTIQRMHQQNFPSTSNPSEGLLSSAAKMVASGSLDLMKLQNLGIQSSCIKSLLTSKTSASMASSGTHSLVAASSSQILSPLRLLGTTASLGNTGRTLTGLKSPVLQTDFYMMQPESSFSSLKTGNVSAAVLEEVMSKDINELTSSLSSQSAVMSLAASTSKVMESMALKIQESSFAAVSELPVTSQGAAATMEGSLLSCPDQPAAEETPKTLPTEASSSGAHEEARTSATLAETSVRDAVSGLLSLPNSTSTKHTSSHSRFRLPFPSATATRTRKIRAPKLYTL